MFERTHGRDNRLCVYCFVLCVVCPHTAVIWNHQDCNRQSMQQVQNTAKVNWDWFVFQCSDTNVVFHVAVFLILVIKNKKRSSDGKTSDCLFRNCLYYQLPLSWVTFLQVTAVLRIVWTCDCCFFTDFLMVTALLVKTIRLNYSKVWYILLVLHAWFNHFDFPFN